jgi:hypothetical protein
MTNAVNTAQLAASTYSYKNRVINGDFRISQYNSSNSITPVDSTYFIDRFIWNQSITGKITFQQNAGSVTPPSGFVNYAGFTSTSSYSLLSTDYWLLRHRIEGYNMADFAWGTANAKTVTLSFWVYSSLPGTFGGIIQNQQVNYNYTYSYTINSANTWQYVTITIPGPTSGTWYNDVRTGIDLWFSLGCGSSSTGAPGTWGSPRIFAPTGQVNVAGTSGAVWNITGIQFEVGTQATAFDYRDYGRELQLCQRYYQRISGNTTNPNFLNGTLWTTTSVYAPMMFPTTMRTAPTFNYSTSTSLFTAFTASATGSTTTISAYTNTYGAELNPALSAGLATTGYSVFLRFATTGWVDFSAEL